MGERLDLKADGLLSLDERLALGYKVRLAYLVILCLQTERDLPTGGLRASQDKSAAPPLRPDQGTVG